MPRENVSQDSLSEANRTRNEFSGYQGALGQAGYRERNLSLADPDVLGRSGESLALSPGPDGFGEIYVGCAWNRLKSDRPKGFFERLFGTSSNDGAVDLDLGCLYEMTDGAKGALQALGDNHGSFDDSPFIMLSHDERTGAAEGDDEMLRINGKKWQSIKRLIIYAYIYGGASSWANVRPEIHVSVPGNKSLAVKPRVHLQQLPVCAIALIENVRNGFKMTNLTEYFPGQSEMDRAYGFGLEWDQGQKER